MLWQVFQLKLEFFVSSVVQGLSVKATVCYLLLKIRKLLLHIFLQSSKLWFRNYACKRWWSHKNLPMYPSFKLFQLYLSHKLHNSQADHPKRTGWYADSVATLKRLQEWRMNLFSSFNLGKFRSSLRLKFWQSLASGSRRSPAQTVYKSLLVKIVRDQCRGRSQELGTVLLCRRSLAIFYCMILLRLHWFT